MSSDILLQAQGLERRYGERLALAGLDLTLARGEILGLLGPNGAGKSTTLRILSGTLPPSAGTVRLGGVDLLARPLAAKRRLGYLPEVPPVYADMRVADYLTYCGRLHGLKRQRLLAAVTRAIERCQLGEVRHRVIGNLSKGYQQRVGLAQAILHKPDVLILDEPTVGLDPLQIRAIRDLIRELKAEHAIIFSSHILPEIEALCDRVVILNRGRAVYQGALGAPASGAHEVLLRCARAPQAERLTGLPGVLEAAALEPCRLRLRLADAAAAETVQRAVLDAGWGLVEWLPLEQNLEQLFVALTHGEGAA